MNPGEILDGRYEIVKRLGAGGMGEVYMATHILLGASRVIKVVHPNISTNADAHERFLREARAATKVQHQNVATVHDFAALPDGSHYMVWEFIDGENLAQRLRARGTLPPKNAVRIAIQALHGLEAIHRAGIIHRDISPENLMIAHADDSVKIIDLGVAKIEEDVGAGAGTKTGIFVGKLRYASPEQLGFLPDGERIDGRADLYALGMVIVELLTGRPPYEAKSPHEYFVIHAREATLSNTVELPAELPGSAALQQSLEKALARDRNARYATAGEFAAVLEEIERSLPDPRNMPTMAMPLDGDETMRVRPQTSADTLHRETLRTQSPAEPTIRTPMPAAMAPPTVATPMPMALAAPPPPPPPPAPVISMAKTRTGIHPLWIIALVFVALLITAGALLWPRVAKSPLLQWANTSTTTPAATTTTATQTTAPSPQTATQVSETSVTVTSPTTTESPLLTSTITELHPTTTETVKPVITPKPKPPVQTETVAEPEQSEEERDFRGPAATYVNGGNPHRNERALRFLHRQLRGVTTISLRATGGTQIPLWKALHRNIPDLELDSDAEIIVRFDGSGRQVQSALGSVWKGERLLFRYESSYESSPEAFAQVIAEAFNP
jgi:serine/threonine protein kinase